jgi:hypothetical protein
MTVKEEIEFIERSADESSLGVWWKKIKSAQKPPSVRRPSA